MARQIKHRQLPSGVSRWFLRAPIWIFRLGLGGLLGKRFLLLNHIGRKSGLLRQAVLEVVIHEKDSNTYYVNAGFGPKTQWLQNLRAHPNVSIQVGWRKWDVRAEVLSPQQSGEVFRRFAEGNKLAATYAKALGFEVDGSLDDYYQMGTMMIFVALRPR
ncbi:MAG: nitroreductase family deazaflavin-dependent oxidoreductase [Anaerolineales bacterium]|nr:nitroreductase family deazaflavin-dependent oxidoreductase [Anaerolineales bacterium]